MNEARFVMVTSHQAPQLTADDQRDHQRGADAHVLEVLQMNRRHAAQEAKRHVEIASCQRRESRLQRDWFIADIDQHPDARTFVQASRHLRDVRRWVTIAKKGFEVGLATFREYLAMSIVV